MIRKTIRELRKKSRIDGCRLWRDVAERLEKPTRQRAEVNVSRINRYTSDGDIVVVPGKVLGAGMIDHPVTVAAIAFSKTAVEKIRAAGGRCLHILDLLIENPPPSKVKVME